MISRRMLFSGFPSNTIAFKFGNSPNVLGILQCKTFYEINNQRILNTSTAETFTLVFFLLIKKLKVQITSNAHTNTQDISQDFL